MTRVTTEKSVKPGGGLPTTVGEYLASVPSHMRPLLEDLRAAIRAAAPQAEECISYKIPTYKQDGPLVHFLAHKDYCSFVTVKKSVVEAFRSELGPFDISGTTIHFTPDQPMPATLVKKIVKARVKENRLAGKRK